MADWWPRTRIGFAGGGDEVGRPPSGPQRQATRRCRTAGGSGSVVLALVLMSGLASCGDSADDPSLASDITSMDAGTTTVTTLPTTVTPPTSTTSTPSSAAATVATHRARWEAAAIDTYDYTVMYPTMFLYGTYRISVVDGAPVSAERLEEGEIKDYQDVSDLPKTIDELFDQLEREVPGDRFVGEFDDELGYPTHVLVVRDKEGTDSEWEFFISDFVAYPA